MTITELKQYIYENNKVEYILEQIGCHHIKYHKRGYFTCANKDGDNQSAINVYNDENLTCINHTRKMSDNNSSDLITLVCFNFKYSFKDGVRYLHKLFGLKYDYRKSKTSEEQNNDPLAIFKKIKRRRKATNVEDIEIHDSQIIEEYEPMLHIEWVREGILEFTRKKFNIGYSYKHKRVVIPHRYWAGEENDYLGVFGRTTVKDYELLGINKFYGLIPFYKSINLYGLQENYKTIQDSGYCVVHEAEKSVMKRHSRLDGTGVAVCSHSLSDEQVRILIGLNVDIVICYDKDIPEEYLWRECDYFYGIRNVYYIYDKYDLLKDKESPADAPDKIYKYLLKHKIKYDYHKREEYVKWLEKQAKN